MRPISGWRSFGWLVLHFFLAGSIVSAGEVEVLAEVAKLRNVAGAAENEGFGSALDLDGNRLAIAAVLDDSQGEESGAVYLYERGEELGWAEVVKLTAADGEMGDAFGFSISLDGDRVAVGARFEGEVASRAGATYLFERDADGAWRQIAKLRASDGRVDHFFGSAVSLSGDTVAIGVWRDDDLGDRAGAVYVFERGVDASWPQVAKLVASDGAEDSYFGISVGLEGERLLVGAHHDDEIDRDAGAVYLFERDDDGDWLEVAKLHATDAGSRDHFGEELSVDGDRFATSADGVYPNNAAYIFERGVDGAWSQAAKLAASDGAPDDFFAGRISLDGDRLAVGASWDNDDGVNSGSVYLFERDVDGSWPEVRKLHAADAKRREHFGTTISFDGGRGIVRAGGGELNGASNSLYVFEPVTVSPRLSASGSCPGEVTLTTQGDTPRDHIELYGARGLGVSPIQDGACAGTILDLDSPTFIARGRVDFDGEQTQVRTLGERWCGTYLQILDQRTCLTSEAVQLPGVDP